MHPNRLFHIADRAAMAAIVRDIGFGIVVARTDTGLRAAHVPVRIEGDRLRFHLARANLVHDALVAGADALFVANGPSAYISPDWYGLADKVPTTNYVAVELNGPVRALARDALAALLDDLSAANAARLAPKRPWTRAKMAPGLFETMLKAITGFEMLVTDWRGTAKLGQDKPASARAGAADALAALGETELAEVMRR
jgi:transcriptional regulator